MMHIDLTTLLTTGAAAKALVMAARSMPEPLPTASYLWRWFYEFMQVAADNTDKMGKSRAHPAGNDTRPAAIPDVVIGTQPLPRAKDVESTL